MERTFRQEVVDTFAQMFGCGGSVYVKGSTRVQLQLLHLSQSVWRVFFWRLFPSFVAAANFDS